MSICSPQPDKFVCFLAAFVTAAQLAYTLWGMRTVYLAAYLAVCYILWLWLPKDQTLIKCSEPVLVHGFIAMCDSQHTHVMIHPV